MRELGLPGGKAAAKSPASRFAPVRKTSSETDRAEALAGPPDHTREAVPLLGRDGEMLQLCGALDAALVGHGYLWLLEGQAGIGKTRLARAVEGAAVQRGFDVFWGRCWDGEGAPAFWPWLKILRPLIAGLDVETQRAFSGAPAAAISQLLPELGQARPEGTTYLSAADAGSARFQLFEGITQILKAQARSRPTLLILDDLHWGDLVSFLLLRFLARELHGVPLLVLGTYRPDELQRDDPRFAELLSIGREAHRLRLRGLNLQDVARLIESVTGKPPSDPLVQSVYQRSGGNPLFIHTLADLPEFEKGAAALALAVPGEIAALVRRHLDRLSPDAHQILGVASAIGQEFTSELLAWALGRPCGVVQKSLDEALASGLILPPPTFGGRFTFRHALIRDVLYQALEPAERREVHRRLGAGLIGRENGTPLEDWSEPAHHFFLAGPDGDADAAVDCARRAATQAVERLAFESAAGHLRSALTALRWVPLADPSAEANLLLKLGEVLYLAGDKSGSDTATKRVLAFARARADGALLIQAVLLRAAWIRIASGEREIISLLEEGLATEPQTSADRVLLLAELAAVLPVDELPRRRRLSEEALALARRDPDDTRVLTRALLSWHWTHREPDKLEERMAVVDEMVGLGARHDGLSALFHGHWLRVSDRLEASDFLGFESDIEAGIRLGSQSSIPEARWIGEAHGILQNLFRGCFDRIESQAEEVFRIATAGQSPSALQYYSAQIFMLRREQGRLAELEPAAREMVDQFPDNPAWRAALAFLYAETGRGVEARREFERLAAGDFAALPRDHNWIVAIAFCSQVAAFLGDRPRAQLLFDLLRPYAGRCCVVVPGLVLVSAVDQNLGVLATVLGYFEDAERYFVAARDWYERIGARPLLAHVQREFAAMLLLRRAHGDDQKAADLLREAGSTFIKLGMTTHAKRLETLRRATPVDVGQHLNRFERCGAAWRIAYGRRVVQLRDAKGLRYLSELLCRMGSLVHVLDLVAAVDGAPAGVTIGRLEDEGLRLGGQDASESTVDARARSEYGQRFRDLQAELEEAERANDLGWCERLRAELDAIGSELGAAYRLASQTNPASVERARKAVTNRIRAALAEIECEHPALARHLAASLKLGTWCGYQPQTETIWHFGAPLG